MGNEAALAPEGLGRCSGEQRDVGLEQGTKAVGGIWDAARSRRDRCGELGYLVDNEIRSEHLEDGVEIVEAWRHLGAHKDLREREASDLRRGQAGGNVVMAKHDGIVSGEPRSERP